ncbi:MAG: PilZ domain-containing protein [Candidatus Omnitrophica bacterium]|nr:PilZ domain-containing protein [Candidatus Omnitrophota bacterium]
MDIKESNQFKIDRRLYPRVNANVSYSVISSEEKAKNVNTKNISVGGIAIFSSREIANGTFLSLSLNLPDMTSCRIKGRVVWSTPVKVSWDEQVNFELGVEFVNISDSEHQSISKYVFLRLDKG